MFMGNIDIVTKEYMRDNKVFADAINYLLYQGRTVIDPAKLEERDSAELAVLFDNDSLQNGKKEKKRLETQQKFRDVLKKIVVMQDGKLTYLILGVENQTDIHYAMPIRNMIYDALQYGKQVNETAAKHREEKDWENNQEYLSGFKKTDKLLPVITLVIHFGQEPWDGPESLHEMLEIQDPEILPYIQDYKIHLIDPARLTEKDLEKFQSSLREVLGCIKYSGNKEKYATYITNNIRMPLDPAANRVIRTVTNIPKTKTEEEQEDDNMEICKAWKDMMDEMMEKGESKGKSEGLRIGRSEGKSEGRNEESERIVVRMLKNGFQPEEIVKITGVDSKRIEEIEEKLACAI